MKFLNGNKIDQFVDMGLLIGTDEFIFDNKIMSDESVYWNFIYDCNSNQQSLV